MAYSDTSRTSPCRIRQGKGRCRAIAERKILRGRQLRSAEVGKIAPFVLLVNLMSPASPLGLLTAERLLALTKI